MMRPNTYHIFVHTRARVRLARVYFANPWFVPLLLCVSTLHRRVCLRFPRKVETLRECKKELGAMIDKTNSHPIMIRLAWHDAGSCIRATAVLLLYIRI